jgi:hypothetical protein
MLLHHTIKVNWQTAKAGDKELLTEAIWQVLIHELEIRIVEAYPGLCKEVSVQGGRTVKMLSKHGMTCLKESLLRETGIKGLFEMDLAEMQTKWPLLSNNHISFAISEEKAHEYERLKRELERRKMVNSEERPNNLENSRANKRFRSADSSELSEGRQTLADENHADESDSSDISVDHSSDENYTPMPRRTSNKPSQGRWSTAGKQITFDPNVQMSEVECAMEIIQMMEMMTPSKCAYLAGRYGLSQAFGIVIESSVNGKFSVDYETILKRRDAQQPYFTLILTAYEKAQSYRGKRLDHLILAMLIRIFEAMDPKGVSRSTQYYYDDDDRNAFADNIARLMVFAGHPAILVFLAKALVHSKLTPLAAFSLMRNFPPLFISYIHTGRFTPEIEQQIGAENSSRSHSLYEEIFVPFLRVSCRRWDEDSPGTAVLVAARRFITLDNALLCIAKDPAAYRAQREASSASKSPFPAVVELRMPESWTNNRLHFSPDHASTPYGKLPAEKQQQHRRRSTTGHVKISAQRVKGETEPSSCEGDEQDQPTKESGQAVVISCSESVDELVDESQ